LRAANRGLCVPCLPRIQHEIVALANRPAHPFHVTQIGGFVETERGPAEFHARVPVVDGALRAVDGLFHGFLKEVRRIHSHAFTQRSAQQRHDRHVESLALDVPQRNIDSSHRLDHSARTAVVQRGRVHLFPQARRIKRVLADQQRAQTDHLTMRHRCLDDRLDD
jgi:hypothetical protein